MNIGKNITAFRKDAGMTQEELAGQIGVSAQAVSKWETGVSMPDILLLPVIADVFGITVDELIGNDEATRAEDADNFERTWWSIPFTNEGWQKKLKLAKEYYAKYPQNFEVMHRLGEAIVNNMDVLEENIQLLFEIHAKIMSGCTEEEYRNAANEINFFESTISSTGGIVMKFWMEVSPEEQLRRFEARRDNPLKNWKITDEDWRNRGKWDVYEEYIDRMIETTNPLACPWIVVESEDKKYGRLKVLSAIVDRLERELS